LNSTIARGKDAAFLICDDARPVTDPFVVERDIRLIGRSLKRSSVSLSLTLLTISGAKLTLTSIDFRCVIQGTLGARISADNCSFTPLDENCDFPLKLFQGSRAFFKHCRFHGLVKAGCLVQGQSPAEFNRCIFETSEASVVTATGHSRLTFYQCDFRGATQSSLSLDYGSSANVTESIFDAQEGVAVTMNRGSGCYAARVNVKSCRGGGFIGNGGCIIHAISCLGQSKRPTNRNRFYLITHGDDAGRTFTLVIIAI
jgi:hypothetical protein